VQPVYERFIKEVDAKDGPGSGKKVIADAKALVEKYAK
jgi:hypothetical protein